MYQHIKLLEICMTCLKNLLLKKKEDIALVQIGTLHHGAAWYAIAGGYLLVVGIEHGGEGIALVEEHVLPLAHVAQIFGSRCFDEEYVNSVESLTTSDSAPLLSGATLTSTAIKQGYDEAKALFTAK